MLRVGELLQLDLGAVLVVGAGFPRGLQLAQVLHRVAAHVADRHTALLGEVAHDLDELAPALLGQLGHDQPHDVAIVGGVQADIGLVDRLLDRP